MTSHEYADTLDAMAKVLRDRPAFPVPDNMKTTWMPYYGDKEGFIAAVRALGAGRKELDENYYAFYPACFDGTLRVYADRSAVCRKVQDVKWECEPLLSDEEAASIGEAVQS